MLSNLSNKPEKMVMIMVISPSTTYLHSGKSTCIKYSLTLMCMGGYYSSFFCEGGGWKNREFLVFLRKKEFKVRARTKGDP